MKVHLVSGMGFSGNVYLVDCEKPCLIDTGWSPDISDSEGKIDGILEGRELAYIILTHRHIDHVGGAMAFNLRFGGDMLVHEKDSRALLEADPESTGATLFGGELAPLPVHTVEEGKNIDLGSGDSLEVIHTPGHTVGSMCLLSKDGELFSGDTVFSGGSVGRWDLPTGDFGQLLESVKRLAGLEVKDLYPGHDVPVSGNAGDHLALSLKYLQLLGRYG